MEWIKRVMSIVVDVIAKGFAACRSWIEAEEERGRQEHAAHAAQAQIEAQRASDFAFYEHHFSIWAPRIATVINSVASVAGLIPVSNPAQLASPHDPISIGANGKRGIIFKCYRKQDCTASAKNIAHFLQAALDANILFYGGPRLRILVKLCPYEEVLISLGV